MNLTKKETNQITKLYNLGKPQKTILFKHGLVNHNFQLTTDKDDYVIRILGHKIDSYKLQRLNLEFKTLNFLEKNKFPYKIPLPIKNTKGKYLSKINNKTFWVYKKIQGKRMKRLNKEKIKEMGKALAIHHKIVNKMKTNSKIIESRGSILLKKYEKMNRIKPKNEVDKIMLENYELFLGLTKEIINKRFAGKLIPIHKDFRRTNVLFQRNKLVGVLDFDNIKLATRTFDLANSIEGICFTWNGFEKEKYKAFIKEYKKILPLSKKEEKEAFELIIKVECKNFQWFYSELAKRPELRLIIMKAIIKETKDLLKVLKK